MNENKTETSEGTLGVSTENNLTAGSAESASDVLHDDAVRQSNTVPAELQMNIPELQEKDSENAAAKSEIQPETEISEAQTEATDNPDCADKYVGKICPYCKTEIKEGEDVIACPACGIPHHRGCWEENNGCTTFGCSEQHYKAVNINPTAVCSTCGALLGANQAFCSSCGTARSVSVGRVCGKCGAELKPGQDFCSSWCLLFTSVISADALDFDVENDVYNSVFVITCGESLGSGFAVSENYILTNAHVVDDGSRVYLESYTGQEYTADIVAMDETLDIAVLYLPDANLPFLSFADLSEMHIGDDVYAIGAPEGLSYTFTKGTLSAKDRVVEGQSYIQTDASINHGNSGGPLLNDSGDVIGMNTLKLDETEGIAFAIPVSRISSYLNSVGIGIDSRGNVAGDVTASETQVETFAPDSSSQETVLSTEENTETKESEELPAVVYCMIGAVAVGIAVYIIIRRKNKTVKVKTDPSERTDFEIDFWE